MPVILQKLFAAAMLVPAISACSPNTLEWKEEILLHDGRKIIADRKDVMGGWAELGQSGSAQKRMITFTNPENPQKKYSHQITGSSNYILRDFYQGMPWLIVYVGPFSDDTKCPIGSYETFTLINDVWRRISYAGMPKDFKNPNMAVSYELYVPHQNDPDQRRRGKILTALQIQEIIESKKTLTRGGFDTTWRLVEKDSDGYVTDCDFIANKMKG